MVEKILHEVRFIETDEGFRIEVNGDKEKLRKMRFGPGMMGFNPGMMGFGPMRKRRHHKRHGKHHVHGHHCHGRHGHDSEEHEHGHDRRRRRGRGFGASIWGPWEMLFDHDEDADIKEASAKSNVE